MEYIDLENWPRRQHFEYFNAVDYPHFNLCANVNIGTLYAAVKKAKLSFFPVFIYVASRSANEIKEFRYRIRGDQVVEHAAVHPSVTIPVEDELFSFCPIPYSCDFAAFMAGAEAAIARFKADPTLKDEPGRDDYLFMTTIPWVSFTGIMHPIHMHPVDSVPRIAWGKYFEEQDVLKMPVSVQLHHAVADGLHAGKYYMKLQHYLDHPEEYM